MHDNRDKECGPCGLERSTNNGKYYLVDNKCSPCMSIYMSARTGTKKRILILCCI
jgi:hypothetical protein